MLANVYLYCVLDLWIHRMECRGSLGPFPGVGPAGGDRELAGLVKELDGIRAAKTQRAMARDIWGDERVADEWSSDGWMRSQARRWIPKAKDMVEGGWLDLPPRTVPEE